MAHGENYKVKKLFCTYRLNYATCDRIIVYAALAQLVEQGTENPCVPGSIPGGGIFLLPKFNNSI